MVTRIAILGDIHGNVAALDAALTAIERARPDLIAITGDLVMNGPRPSDVLARVRALDAAGAYVVQGNTDIAVADFDFSAAFPWLDEVPEAHRAVAEWTHDQLSDDELAYLRRLPSERRIRVGDLLVLVCHGSPGSQTSRGRMPAPSPADTPTSRRSGTSGAASSSIRAPAGTPSTAMPAPPGRCSRSTTMCSLPS